MRNKRFRKKSGFILLPVILAMFIVGLLGVGLASMYSGTFSTLQAGQAASQAKQFASIEAAAIKARGYDDAESGAHGWQDMTSLVGSEDGSKWQSKVETMRTDTTPDGNNVKVMKVSTRKNGELVSRYSEEIPVVEGLDVYSKDEIDSMFSTVDHQIGTLTTDLTNLTTRMTNAESSITNLSGDINTINSNIDSINADLDTLQKMINANTSLINDETSYRKTADTNLQNNINKEANARTSAVNAINLQINSLKSTLSNLQGALTSEANARKASDSTLQSNINSEASARAKAIQDLAAEVNNKYTELKNLYDGIKGRLDGKEFVRSKDATNNISLKYEQLAGEDKKSIHAYVDGNLVPLASQNSQQDSQLIYRTVSKNYRCLYFKGKFIAEYDEGDPEPYYIHGEIYSGSELETKTQLYDELVYVTDTKQEIIIWHSAARDESVSKWTHVNSPSFSSKDDAEIWANKDCDAVADFSQVLEEVNIRPRDDFTNNGGAGD